MDSSVSNTPSRSPSCALKLSVPAAAAWSNLPAAASRRSPRPLARGRSTRPCRPRRQAALRRRCDRVRWRHSVCRSGRRRRRSGLRTPGPRRRQSLRARAGRARARRGSLAAASFVQPVTQRPLPSANRARHRRRGSRTAASAARPAPATKPCRSPCAPRPWLSSRTNSHAVAGRRSGSRAIPRFTFTQAGISGRSSRRSGAAAGAPDVSPAPAFLAGAQPAERLVPSERGRRHRSAAQPDRP